MRILMGKATILVHLIVSLHIQKIYTTEIHLISDSRFLTEADTLVSPTGIFELGFFRPGTSENKYIGIWYKKSVQTVVWVANRDFPLPGASSGILKIISPGNLVLINDTNVVVWSSNTTSSVNAFAQLDDNGNLILKEIIEEKILWQSFDYPTDTLLPGMKLGRSFLTGKEWHLSSWKSNQDPAPGDFTWSTDTNGFPQILLKQATSIRFRIGPWNGIWFSGGSGVNRNIINADMVINGTEVVYSYLLRNSSVVSRLVLSTSGQLERWVWVADGKKWQLFFQLQRDFCDGYNICYAYGTCSVLNSQRCGCLDETRFVPRKQKGWEIADWSGGCVRRTPLDCRTDGFIKYSHVKLPDTRTSWYNMSMNRKECEEKCIKNCSCMAYSDTDIRGEGSGCLLWFNDLMDIRVFSQSNNGQDIFVRMASSELVHEKQERANLKIILPVVFLGVLLIGSSLTWFHYACRKRHDQQLREGEFLDVGQSQRDTMELPLFSFSTLARATASFSPNNKIGEGGFGSVYKGLLEEGLEIAVKRLSTTSRQGLDEFKNEVICISKLQHRNLVKLLGCSIQGDEKLLIYEYMPNRSLDLCLFDKTRSTQLDWTTRFNIIKGIARGLLYLHQDSRLRIIHRDLKASNILLDKDMNPKISDFGMARSFGGNESQANTQRVVGTYGYMSPEYALDGVFSFKSDVFSFGVLVLEIVSGKRNRGFIHSKHDNNLLGHAWRMHNEGRSLELVDTSLSRSSNSSEVIRSIIVGLLCVQQSPNDRPNMSSVVLMLGNEGIMQKPKQPGFFIERILHGADISSSSYPTSSTNDLTVTEVVAR
ncbi:G-type lectin S-receptor-like serine/threonine-protein kinase At4g27290 [Lactuca sativa]|uniref:G-type lectin S-receptor-like serine/threonine-protein kinase At4g27290 n=1 Tax=Lactuca sativa TaxID=4236 RepID=UPI000CC599B1|nr:G-type lectin S-receptor-like serine/threonine-protein kinase At4g27290 [Lactuca sativa]